MNRNCLKSQKGITLLTLTIYIIVLTLVIGIMGGISKFFHSNILNLNKTVENAGDFDTLNSSIIIDVKNNRSAYINENAKTIIFEDGTTYQYNEAEKTIYRDDLKVAKDVKYFKVNTSTKIVDNVQKQILTINIIIGNSSKNLISQKIDYTLKYW